MSHRFHSIIAGLVTLLCAGVNAFAAAPADEVLLRRGDITVTRADFMHMLENAVPEGGRAAVLADERKVRMLIADLFVIRELAAEARQAGLADDELVRFKIAVQQDRTLMDALLDKAVADSARPDFEKIARERYTTSPERFRQGERVRASHILIGPKEGRSKDQAKTLAEEVRKQALQGQKTFEDLVLEYSDDKSAKTNRGDLGFFERERMVKPFAEAAFAMEKPGDISPVVESQFGFHVIRYVDRKPARQLGFDEVKRKIIDTERQQFEARVRTERIEAARSLDDIKVNQDAVSAISEEARKAVDTAVNAASEKKNAGAAKAAP
ncbi:MAG: peptidylprolyl isomerase [Gammaproteobacteria bacterium]|nr:peptidylprolyl isomerase [Gammaproteobacteria bacterium]